MTLADLRAFAWLLGATLTSAAVAAEPDVGDDQEPLDMEFLEYLGMWEETDEEWQLLDDTVALNDEPRDAEPQGEESTENDDES